MGLGRRVRFVDRPLHGAGWPRTGIRCLLSKMAARCEAAVVAPDRGLHHTRMSRRRAELSRTRSCRAGELFSIGAHAGTILAAGPFRYGLIARWFLKALAPTGSKPVPAPKLFRPSSSHLECTTVVSHFQEVHLSFIAVAASADGLDLDRIRIASPALALLGFPLGIWLLSTASHMLRHLNQAQDVRSHGQFPQR